MKPRASIRALFCAAMLIAALSPGIVRAQSEGSAALRGKLMKMIGQMTLEEKVGQMFVTYGYGRAAEDADPAMIAANRRDHGVDNLRQLVERYHLGGVIYFAWSGNVQHPKQIASLSNDLQDVATSSSPGVPLLISTDQEQGVVVRVTEPATQFPGNMALGAAREEAYARAAAAITGEELAAIGINQNLAPVADVNVNPHNPVIGVRSFSSRAELVSALTEAEVLGYRDHVAATAKHFPGHGDTDVDSHTGLPVINHSRDELETIDLPPFRAAIDAGVEAIMTAHIVVPALDDSRRPATLSRPILTKLLRKEMGFDGLIVTDALTMEGVRTMFGDARVPIEAIKAGADVLLMPPNIDLAYNAVLDAVESGEIGEGRINHSVYRILRLKHDRGVLEDPFIDEAAVDATVGTSAHLVTADSITERTTTLVKNDAGLLPLESGAYERALVTGWGVTTTATLGSELQAREIATEVFETGANPGAAAIEAAAARAADKDLVVVTTMNAWSRPGQRDLVERLLQTGVPVVVLAVRDPYDIAHFTDAPTYVAAYGFRSVSLRAATKTLFGEINPSGRLPVDIPRADDPATVLYGFGHGLSY